MKHLKEFINESSIKDELDKAVKKLGGDEVSNILHSMFDNDPSYESKLDKLDRCPDNEVADIVWRFFPISAIIDKAENL